MSKFVIFAIYIDDIKLIGTPEKLQEVINYLKKEFAIKNIEKFKFYLNLQIEHLEYGIFVHRLTYTTKVLKRFYMDKSHLLSTPMVVRSLDVTK